MFSLVREVVHSRLGPILMLGGACWLSGLNVQRACYGQSTAKQEASSGVGAEAHDPVLRHAVFFKFKPSSPKEDVARVVAAFRALPSKIEEIIEFSSGENISRAGFDDGLTHCFLLTFQDEAHREVYLPHPDHEAFVAVLRPHLDKVFVIDYWGRRQATRLERELKHAVFLKFKDNTTPADVRAVENELAGLPSKIDAIKAFEWGMNNSPETHDQGFTHCFMFTFGCEEDLQEYVAHLAHKSAANKLKPKVEEIRVLSFWAEDASQSNVR